MMFAQIIRRYQPKLHNCQILEMFLDKPSAPLSIHRICQLGSTLYSGVPGKYWNCLTGMLCLKDLYLESITEKSGSTDKKPLNCFTFTNNTMSFEEMTAIQFGEEEIDVVPENENYCFADIKPVYIHPKLIFFIGVFGGDEISLENFLCMKEIFKLPSCMGMIAGVQTKAHFLIGTVNEDFIYLDPHHTHTASELHTEAGYRSFFPPSDKIKTLSYKCFNPCVGVSFLLNNKDELKQLKDCFRIMIHEYSGSFLMDENDQGLYNMGIKDLEEAIVDLDAKSIHRRHRKSSTDEFEVLGEIESTSFVGL